MDKNINDKNDFLRQIVAKDLKDGKYNSVLTRFPPEPNGFPHIGHAKSICINFGIARDFNGECNLRMDDTNPTKENNEYVKALQDAVNWLGFKWKGDMHYTSDYFDELYEYAVKLIKMGKAYVDSISEDEIKEFRGSVTSPGKRSKFASRSVDENLELFSKMAKGEFKDGEHILRAKIDMANPNMKMRDPLLYRIRNTKHFRTGDKWHIYPMYDFAHCLSDYIEGISHSICTLEFENNRELYDWILDNLDLTPPRPYQYEFARLNINYTVMSKRKLLALVNEKKVSGWDDPRMPTIAGLKRRGYTPESIINFCDSIGIAKANSMIDISQLEFCIRDDLNLKVPRVLAVLDPIKVVIENYPLDKKEYLEADFYPHDVPKEGSRKLAFGKEIYIDRNDFNSHPPKGYFRLTPNQAVRLKFAYIISLNEVIKDENGKITELRVNYHPNSKMGEDTSGIKTKSAIQWLNVDDAIKAEVRIYDRLYKVENPDGMEDLNENSLKIIKNAFVEKSVLDSDEERFQFEREGYFYKDPIDFSEKSPVFNKIVSLKDSWNKKSAPKKEAKKEKEAPQKQILASDLPMNEEEKALFNEFTKLNLNEELANILVRDEKLSKFYKTALKEAKNPIILANLVANEVSKEFKDGGDFKFNEAQICDLANLIEDEIISVKIAKEVFAILTKTGKNPSQIVEEKGLKQISDENEILKFIDEALKSNPKKLEEFKAGNDKLMGFFVGLSLKISKGKANPKILQKLVLEELNKLK